MENRDCRYFRGNIPCKYHKEFGVHCEHCKYYDSIKEKILIIKLGAVGDVIRTTPLLCKLRKVYPKSEIHWLTHTLEVVPKSHVDYIWNFSLENILTLQSTKFDILYNLDKDKEACALTRTIYADIKKGFTLADGKCIPIDKDAEHKWLTGLFDNLNRANTKSYPEEIFEICGFKFNGEKYILDKPPNGVFTWSIEESKPIIGLNTGCGARWTTRIWPEEKWIELANRLKKSGYGVILLGGEQEHEKNLRISENSKAAYFGHFPLMRFISLVGQCNLIVTAVTMALHIAIALEKKIVLFNNIFNRHEFELYGLGEIIEPDVDCKGCYRQNCDKDCMKLISVQEVYGICKKLLS